MYLVVDEYFSGRNIFHVILIFSLINAYRKQDAMTINARLVQALALALVAAMAVAPHPKPKAKA